MVSEFLFPFCFHLSYYKISKCTIQNNNKKLNQNKERKTCIIGSKKGQKLSNSYYEWNLQQFLNTKFTCCHDLCSHNQNIFTKTFGFLEWFIGNSPCHIAMKMITKRQNKQGFRRKLTCAAQWCSSFYCLHIFPWGTKIID